MNVNSYRETAVKLIDEGYFVIDHKFQVKQESTDEIMNVSERVYYFMLGYEFKESEFLKPF